MTEIIGTIRDVRQRITGPPNPLASAKRRGLISSRNIAATSLLRTVAPLLLSLIVLPGLAQADVNLGFISFDSLIPGAAGSPGVNAFTIANFTGDPAFGGYALPPTFPITTALTFLNCSLALTSNGSTTILNLGDIPAGFFSSTLLQFADTETFSSAIFAGTLDVSTVQLADGSTITLTPMAFATGLLPSGGPTLTAGTDFAVIDSASTMVSTPEPPVAILLPGCFLALLLWQRRSRIAR